MDLNILTVEPAGHTSVEQEQIWLDPPSISPIQRDPPLKPSTHAFPTFLSPKPAAQATPTPRSARKRTKSTPAPTYNSKQQWKIHLKLSSHIHRWHKATRPALKRPDLAMAGGGSLRPIETTQMFRERRGLFSLKPSNSSFWMRALRSLLRIIDYLHISSIDCNINLSQL